MNPIETGSLALRLAEKSAVAVSSQAEPAAALFADAVASCSGKFPDIAKLSEQAGLGSVLGATRLQGGVVNNVYRIETTGKPFIARFCPDSLSVYQKEHWAMDTAASRGVITPRIFKVGDEGTTSYMLMEDVGRRTLADLEGDRGEALQKLGKQIALTNGIKVEGFGFSLDLSNPQKPFFTQSWKTMKAGENRYIFDGGPLVKLGALSAKENLEAQKFLQPMLDWNFEPRLCHGDVSLNNAIMRDDGAVAVIDWTQAKGGVAPYFDLARLSTEIPAELPSFLKGYGITPQQFASQSQNYQRVALTDVLRAGSWAQRTSHSEPQKFVADIRKLYESVIGA